MPMMGLLKMETFRLMKQRRTYFAIAAVFLIEAVVMLSAYYQGNTIIDILLNELKNSFYFEGTLLNGNLVAYLILNSLWFHLPLILMIIVSSLLTSEYKDRTLQTAMMQPVSKVRYLFSKYLLAIIFTLAVVFTLCCTSLALSYGIFGQGDLIVYLQGLNFYEQQDAFERLLLAFAFGSISMVFYSVVSLTIAVILKEAIKTWIVSVFFLIISNLLLKVDFGSSFLNQILYFKLNDSWQYFFYYDIPWSDLLQNAGLLIVYIIIVISIGLYLFRKKDID